MTFGKNALFSLLIGLDLLTNVLELAHINFLYTTTLLSFCTSILLPGFLISLILRLKKLSFWENLLFIIGLGIAFLEFGGLLLNIFLPLLGIKNPLAFQNSILGFDIYMLFLLRGAWIRTQPFALQIQLPIRSTREKFLYILPTLFPVLASFGAIMLNNGGSNILTLILLGAIACYTLLLVLSHDKIAPDLYPYSIFFIATALLFTTSLRSWYITGHDIEREFYVFQLTNTHHLWNMAFYQDIYNACLSITILPTVLTNMLAIQDMYVYKVIFQILFATSPILVFFIMRNYTTPVLAFLCAFFFISFPTFFNDMPMLNRQEIGFIFFGLTLYMLLLAKLPVVQRKILFTIFALAVIVSHYSTNFVLLILVAFLYTFTLILSRPFVKTLLATLFSVSHLKLQNTFSNKAFLQWPLVLLLFFMTYCWNTLYTNSSNHVGSVIVEVMSNIFVKSNNTAKSSDVSYSIFSSPNVDPEQELRQYAQNILQAEGFLSSDNSNQLYSKSITDKYPSYPMEQEELALTPLGHWLASFHLPLFNIQAALRSLSASFMQIFVFIGLLAIFFVKNKKPFDLQYLLLCFGALFLLALITILPALSVDYGLLRMFQQLLFLLSLPIVLGINSIVFFMQDQKRLLFTTIIALLFFLTLTGFISHLTGAYYPQITLDNAGIYYDAYYVHSSDILAIAWLSKNNPHDETVDADFPGTNKLLTYGGINTLDGSFPTTIQKQAYVYLEVSSQRSVSIGADILIFNSPQHFLDANKDLIYSNGKNNIYK